MKDGRRHCHLVCGGGYHDFDRARLRLLSLLANHPEVRTTVGQDWADTELVRGADLIISYTCDLRISQLQAGALRARIESGGRWLALHASNAVAVPSSQGLTSPSLSPDYDATLGSLFVAHPPVGEFEVLPSLPEHPLVAGLAPFTVRDELFLIDVVAADVEPLLEAKFLGSVEGFDRPDWTDGDGRRLIAYTRMVGEGRVTYLALGHSHGPHDGYPGTTSEPGPWESERFLELLRRGVEWAISGRFEH
jgi:uncharacterized protein